MRQRSSVSYKGFRKKMAFMNTLRLDGNVQSIPESGLVYDVLRLRGKMYVNRKGKKTPKCKGKKRSRNTHFAASGYNTTSSLLSNRARSFGRLQIINKNRPAFIETSCKITFAMPVVGFEIG
jgi:hypothetical protein